MTRRRLGLEGDDGAAGNDSFQRNSLALVIVLSEFSPIETSPPKLQSGFGIPGILLKILLSTSETFFGSRCERTRCSTLVGRSNLGANYSRKQTECNPANPPTEEPKKKFVITHTGKTEVISSATTQFKVAIMLT